MNQTDDSEGASLHAAVVDAKADFRAAANAMTPEAGLLLMESPAGSSHQGNRRAILGQPSPARGPADAYQAADKRLQDAKRALRDHQATQRAAEHREMLAGYAERCERKTAALVASGVQGGTSVQYLGPYGRPR